MTKHLVKLKSKTGAPLRRGGCGTVWDAQGKVVDSGDYSKKQWQAILGEPRLSVTAAEDAEPGEKTGKEIPLLFTLSDSERIPPESVAPGAAIEAAVADCEFADGRPDWCRSGKVWLARNDGQEVAVCRTKAAAEAWLSPAPEGGKSPGGKPASERKA